MLRPHPARIRERARSLFQEGEKLSKIAEILDINPNTVKVWKQRDHWQRDTPETSNSSAPQILPLSPVSQQLQPQVEVEIPASLTEQQAQYSEDLTKAALTFSGWLAKQDAPGLVRVADKAYKMDSLSRKTLKLESQQPSTVIQIGVLAGHSIKTTSKRDDGRLRSVFRPKLENGGN
jgi:hypothetical protein